MLDEKIKAQIAKGKQYTVVFLKPGPKRDQSETEATRIQEEHLKYLFSLKEKGLLLINGPFMANEEIRGMGIYDTDDTEEAIRIASLDPAVQAGRLTVEAHEWFSIPGGTLK